MATNDNGPSVPMNIEAEYGVLGAILIEPKIYPDIAAILQPEHFYNQKHRWIFEACATIAGREEPIDMITLSTELDTRHQLEPIGGMMYISQLVNSVPSSVHAETYARLVREAYGRRQVLDLVSDVARLAHDGKSDMHSARAYIQTRLDELLTPTGPQKYMPFSELAPTLRPIEWLWENWLPLGMISMLGAVPGAGKSLVALDLSRRVMEGKPFPDGTLNPYHRTGANVIYVDAEMVPQMLNDRISAWNMDCKNLYLMLPRANSALDFSKPDDQQRLRSMAETLKPALIIVDSLSSVNPRSENNIEDIRALLAFLNELASTAGTSILLIHHLRKRGGPQMSLPLDLTIDDFRGSSHIIAMARSVMGLSIVQVGPEMDRNGPRKLEVLKTNLCAYPDPLGCEVQPGYPRGVVLKWANEAPRPYKEPTKQEACLDWLRLELQSGPIAPKDLIDQAAEEGYSRATVFRARSMAGLAIRDTEGRQSPVNKWEWVTLN